MERGDPEERLGQRFGRTVWPIRVDNEFTLVFLRQLGDDPQATNFGPAKQSSPLTGTLI